MKSFKLLLPAVALAMAGIAGAGVRSDADVPSVVVQYGDLNLNSKAGVLKLRARLRSAARDVCSALDTSVLGKHGRYEACVDDALSKSIAAVGNVHLGHYHRYRTFPAVLASS
jgi:UrcA family protein